MVGTSNESAPEMAIYHSFWNLSLPPPHPIFVSKRLRFCFQRQGQIGQWAWAKVQPSELGGGLGSKNHEYM